MSIPNEALQKLAREIEGQALAAQQQIAIARTQMAGKQREQRLTKLTLSELSSLPDDTVVYEGVGKMFSSLPVADLRKKLDSQTKDIESDVDKLSKRLIYLETTHKNSRDHIEQMLRKANVLILDISPENVDGFTRAYSSYIEYCTSSVASQALSCTSEPQPTAIDDCDK